jgi:hypothetical protein
MQSSSCRIGISNSDSKLHDGKPQLTCQDISMVTKKSVKPLQTSKEHDTLESTLTHQAPLTWTKDQRVMEAACGLNSSAYPSTQDLARLSASLHHGRMAPKLFITVTNACHIAVNLKLSALPILYLQIAWGLTSMNSLRAFVFFGYPFSDPHASDGASYILGCVLVQDHGLLTPVKMTKCLLIHKTILHTPQLIPTIHPTYHISKEMSILGVS